MWSFCMLLCTETVFALMASGPGASATHQASSPPATKKVLFHADPALLGTWQAEGGRLLPPGIAAFEVIGSALALDPDGDFTLTVEKATGTLRRTGRYTVTGGTLTLAFDFGPVIYAFHRVGASLTLLPAGHGVNDLLSLHPRVSPGKTPGHRLGTRQELP